MKNSKRNILQLIISLCLIITGVFILNENTSAATYDPVTINKVDYEEENIIINNYNNTRIFFATETEASKDNWESLDADVDASGNPLATTTIDISWLSPSVENTLMFKGEGKAAVSARAIVVERTRKLEISINYSAMDLLAKGASIAPLLNIMTTAGTSNLPITYNDLEWKKGDVGKWKSIAVLTVAQLEKYQIRGTYLYFRIKAVPADTVGGVSPLGIEGRRVSAEVKLKIAKKSAPMVVGIDGEEFTAEIKYGKEYRVTTVDGTSGWIQITDRAIKILPLKTILQSIKDDTTGAMIYPDTDGTIESKVFPGMFLEIREYSTSKAASSKITEITLEDQGIVKGDVIQGKAPEGATTTDLDIYISYNGIKNMIIAIPSATIDNPYEYCVVKPSDIFDIQRVVWTSITKGTDIQILASKAIEGGTLYVRKKEIKSQEATNTSAAVPYSLASTYVTCPIMYPAIPNITDKSFVFTKGDTTSVLFFTVTLNVTGRNPFETEIKNIKLGTKELEFDVTTSPVIPNPVDPAIVYVMTVTLDNATLNNMTNCYARLLTINFENGTVDKYSIKLTIKSPTPAMNLTVSATSGSAAGNTAAKVVSTLGLNNSFVYTIDNVAVTGVYVEDTLTTGIAFTQGADIAITAGKYLTVYEINTTTHNFVKFKSILITADMIKST